MRIENAFDRNTCKVKRWYENDRRWRTSLQELGNYGPRSRWLFHLKISVALKF
jgi:hypothetical protein